MFSPNQALSGCLLWILWKRNHVTSVEYKRLTGPSLHYEDAHQAQAQPGNEDPGICLPTHSFTTLLATRPYLLVTTNPPPPLSLPSVLWGRSLQQVQSPIPSTAGRRSIKRRMGLARAHFDANRLG